ncbi:hypothetical protein TSUD_407640 [Trifolium subterraneum]|uniref:Reverse transcriptase domain-containing protein n=1 Tax=Trifolium subterraneum TaxID=3900 RepID=A0A2Z6PQX1_TRISU|nr:hypothetical protein TSUD_407640 [Trifolium subterraneum]
MLMEDMVTRNLFTGYRIGERDPVFVSHLQFTDDTLQMGVKSWGNVRALRVILVMFKTMSGLKVNFNNSLLVGVNILDSWLLETSVDSFKGKIVWVEESLPFSWWLFGSAIVCLDLSSCLCHFLLQSSLKLLVDREGFWFRVLAARYGMDGGRLRDGGRRGSSWWREIMRIREGGELGAYGLRRMFRKRCGTGFILFSVPIPGWMGLKVKNTRRGVELYFEKLFLLRVVQSPCTSKEFYYNHKDYTTNAQAHKQETSLL